MKATEIRINKSCREFHGDEGAWDEAIKWMKSFNKGECHTDFVTNTPSDNLTEVPL